MSDIIVSYSKEQKKTAIKLVAKLESEGYSCWIEPRDIEAGTEKIESYKKALDSAQILIIIFSTIADKSTELVTQYDLAFEHDLGIIPFIVSDVEMSVSMQHFLNTHDWINAYDSSFDEAVSNLIQLIEEDDETDVQKNEAKPKNKKNSDKQTINQKQKNYIIAAVSLVLIIIVGIILFYPDNSSSNMEELIVGTWKLSDYEDNMERTPEELASLSTTIATLKQTVSLSFYEDKSFERVGFQPQPESGLWKIDEQNKTLFLTSKENPGKSADALLIEEISEKKITLVVAETVNENQQVITKLTFEKK